MLQDIKEKLYNFWDGTKAWFKRSQVVFLARLEAGIGFLVVALSVADWGPLFVTGLTWTQTAVIGLVMTVKGIVTEWARRLGTKEVSGQLIPADITVKEVKAVQEIKAVEKKAEK